MIPRVGPSSRPSAAGVAGVVPVAFSPITATKLDPNGLELSAPTDLGGDLFRLHFDASGVARTTPAAGLAYVGDPLDLDYGDAWLLDILASFDAPSDTKLVAGVLLSTDASLGAGVQVATKLETGVTYDHWVRDMATAVPAVGGASGPLQLRCTIRCNGAGKLESAYSVRTIDGLTWRSWNTRREHTDAAYAGGTKARLAMYAGFELTKSAVEYVDVGMQYRILTY